MLLDYGIPFSTHPKGIFHRKPYPNSWRDDCRRRHEHVIYANCDHILKDAPKQGARDCEILWGGLLTQFGLPWNFSGRTDEEETLDVAKACETSEYEKKMCYPFTNKRRHIRFPSGRLMLYCPAVRPLTTMPSQLGNIVSGIENSCVRPDSRFIRETEKALMMYIHYMAKREVNVSSIFLNPGLVNLKYFTCDVRDSVIRHIASTIKKQTNLESLTCENLFLGSTDAMRIILAAALGAGDTLQSLYLFNLFLPKLLPFKLDSEYFDIYNEFESEAAKPYCPLHQVNKDEIYNNLLEKPFYGSLPTATLDKYFQMSFHMFSNLTTLGINYVWLSKGNGLNLLQVESIRNGKLKNMILFLGAFEDPDNVKQVICYKAWAKALEMCPDFKLHLIIGQNASLLNFKSVLMKSMPLASIAFASIYPLATKLPRPWLFSYITRFLQMNFHRSLENVNMTIWNPSCKVDICISNFFRRCTFLREFVYRGHLDNFSTIHEICRFLLTDQCLRLKKLHFFVADDPCRPNGWTNAIEVIQRKYKIELANKGISLVLGIWKL